MNTTPWRTLICITLGVSACGAPSQETTPPILLETDMPSTPDMSDVLADMSDSPTYTPRTFAEASWKVYCEAHARCPEYFLHINYESVDACIAEPRLASSRWQTEEALRRGELRFQAAKAPACIEAYREALCTKQYPSYEELPACQGLFNRDQPEGQACALTLTCELGTYCPINTAGCQATCTRNPVQCGDTTCAPGQYCESVNKTCAPLLAEGQDCYEGDACVPGTHCTRSYNVRCNGNDCAYSGDPVLPGTCAPSGTQATGQPCWTTQSCQTGLVCEDETCQRPTFAAQGAACVVYDEVQRCQQGLVCAPSEASSKEGTCRPPLGPGEPCLVVFQCSRDAYCAADKVCRAKKPDGQPCETSGECVHGLCDPANGVCATDLDCP